MLYTELDLLAGLDYADLTMTLALGILRHGYYARSLLVEPPLSKAACVSGLPLELDLVLDEFLSTLPGLILQMILTLALWETDSFG